MGVAADMRLSGIEQRAGSGEGGLAVEVEDQAELVAELFGEVSVAEACEDAGGDFGLLRPRQTALLEATGEHGAGRGHASCR